MDMHPQRRQALNCAEGTERADSRPISLADVSLLLLSSTVLLFWLADVISGVAALIGCAALVLLWVVTERSSRPLSVVSVVIFLAMIAVPVLWLDGVISGAVALVILGSLVLLLGLAWIVGAVVKLTRRVNILAAGAA